MSAGHVRQRRRLSVGVANGRRGHESELAVSADLEAHDVEQRGTLGPRRGRGRAWTLAAVRGHRPVVVGG